MEPTSAQFQLPCRHLRNKEMYYGAPEDDAFAGGQCWCDQTQEAFGPDGQPAGRPECSSCERACYRAE